MRRVVIHDGGGCGSGAQRTLIFGPTSICRVSCGGCRPPGRARPQTAGMGGPHRVCTSPAAPAPGSLFFERLLTWGGGRPPIGGMTVALTSSARRPESPRRRRHHHLHHRSLLVPWPSRDPCVVSSMDTRMKAMMPIPASSCRIRPRPVAPLSHFGRLLFLLGFTGYVSC